MSKQMLIFPQPAAGCHKIAAHLRFYFAEVRAGTPQAAPSHRPEPGFLDARLTCGAVLIFRRYAFLAFGERSLTGERAGNFLGGKCWESYLLKGLLAVVPIMPRSVAGAAHDSGIRSGKHR